MVFPIGTHFAFPVASSTFQWKYLGPDGEDFTHTRGFTMQLASLHDLFVAELKDLYSAETQLVKALPKMAKAASSKELKNGFEKHLKQTEAHVERIQQVCEELKFSPRGKKCKAMEGLIHEGEEIIKKEADPEAKDAALIAAAQKVEHYEIAGYGCVRTYAEHMGHKNAARLLQKTLDEEGETDKSLTKLAMKINVEANTDGASMEDSNGAPKKGKPKPLRRRILSAVGL
jgi:ferritin-like metal-binding protein YciE